MNNLYGKAMSKHLPYGGFKWVEVYNESINKVLNKNDNSLHSYFLEVDLKCPEEFMMNIKISQWHQKKSKYQKKF